MSITQPVGVALVGVGGHAVTHLDALRQLQEQGIVKLHAVVEAAPDRWRSQLDDLARAGIAIEPDLPRLLHNWRDKVAVVGVPVGIPAHRPVAVQVLEAGCSVVLEKPVVGCIDDFGPIRQAAAASGRTCAVHFQWIWMRGLQAAKAAIVAGKIGRLREVRVMGRWFRPDRYYTRNGWAGHLRLGQTWILDGTINNPFAHQVNNALFLAGAAQHDWARPVEVHAELYHARPNIAGDDTTCLHVRTDTTVDLRLWFTLCSGEQAGPTTMAIGEKGRIVWPLTGGAGEIRYDDGRVEAFPGDDTPGSQAVYANVCNYLAGRDERVLCTLDDAWPFTATVSAAYQAAGPPAAVDERYVRRVDTAKGPGYVVDEIDATIAECFEKGLLFNEAGLGWTAPARGMRIDETYSRFDPAWVQ